VALPYLGWECGVRDVFSLFWITHRHRRKNYIFLVEAASEIHARLKAAIAKHPGEYVETLKLDPPSARKIPAKMRGRTLTMEEVEKLAKRKS
jgi:hypothetical protein